MTNIKEIQFKNHKSFKDWNTIANLKRVNVIIGKNNSGKSSVLDIVEQVFDKDCAPIENIEPILLTQEITQEAIKSSFGENEYGSIIGRAFDYGKKFIGRNFKSSYSKKYTSISGNKYVNHNAKFFENEVTKESKVNCDEHWQRLSTYLINSIPSCCIRRISAERDVVKEDGNVSIVYPNGNGVTSKIYSYITLSDKDEKLIEITLLNELNKILAEDAHFDNLKIQQVKEGENYLWEIFLSENGERYELSKMGSGLKTIIIMLVNLLICSQENKKKCLFLFEELENNLHPALQRRVFEYIYEYANSNDCIIFLTTHSHVAINCFYEKENATIYHVEKDNYKSTIREVNNYIDKVNILTDLDVKASDLFQSNGIIWVEGPSDRIYVKKWLEINYPQLVENMHYQFMYYGGKLLSHFTAEEEENLIDILLTNHNSAILMDSDKLKQGAKIRTAKTKIKDQFEKKKLFCWITKGKEIENYISAEDINKSFESNLKQVGTYEPFSSYIKPTFKNFEQNKVNFASKVSTGFNKQSLSILDLNKNINKLAKEILKWNKIEKTTK